MSLIPKTQLRLIEIPFTQINLTKEKIYTGYLYEGPICEVFAFLDDKENDKLLSSEYFENLE